MHEDSKEAFAPLPSRPAFAEAEVAALEQWVRRGGALLLIADHMPVAGHTETLAAAFGIRFHNGFALDARGNGQITFRRSEGSLVAGPVADGRSSPSARHEFPRPTCCKARWCDGEGRIAVFGEAAAFTAQVAGPQRFPAGMNSPDAPENARYLPNVMHWLGGTLN